MESNTQINVRKVIIGNKCDKPDILLREEEKEGRKFAYVLYMNFF